MGQVNGGADGPLDPTSSSVRTGNIGNLRDLGRFEFFHFAGEPRTGSPQQLESVPRDQEAIGLAFSIIV